MQGETFPDWLRPPPDGFTADDIDRLPQLPPHTELVDGSIVLPAQPTKFHSHTAAFVKDELHRLAPDGFQVHSDVSLIIDPRQRLDPDILISHTAAHREHEPANFRPSEVELVVEVVSPATEARDRERKPQIYAQGAIPHFWRIEDHDGTPAVHVYQLDPADNTYFRTGIHDGRVRLGLPFDVDIDLTVVDRA